MTEQSIIKKLRDILSEEVDSECKVVYVMVETRKLLEMYPPDPCPFALRLYCHWALHVDLDRPRTTLPFLNRVDEFAASFLEGNKDISLEHQILQEFIFLQSFREQFKQFLQSYGVPTDVCDVDSRWHEFLQHYSGVIEYGSLSCEGKGLKLVEKVIFRRGKLSAADSYIPFNLTWDVVLLDKRTLTMEVNAEPLSNGEPVISSSAHLH
jgi:hypothetical protein